MTWYSGRVADGPAHGYPRPQLRRDRWASLGGLWEFAFGEGSWDDPGKVCCDRTIRVPFAPETRASGIGDTGFHPACWYRRSFRAPVLKPEERLLLHFGAVDYAATVWVNGAVAARHTGGYTPFEADLTLSLVDGVQTVIVFAEDDPLDLEKPRGKQDWQLEPHSIWYPRTSGIRQSVWLERVGATRLGDLRWRSNLERWEVGVGALIVGMPREDLRLKVRLSSGRARLAAAPTKSTAGRRRNRGPTCRRDGGVASEAAGLPGPA